MNKFLIHAFVLAFVSVGVNAQENSSVNTGSLQGSLSDQFEFVTKKSNNFQDYKVVKSTHLSHLRKSSLDSVNRYKKELDELKDEVNNHAQLTKKAQDDLVLANAEIDNLQKIQDSMSFFGMQMSKAAYSLLMWGIIIVLSILLFLFVYRSKSIVANSKDMVHHLSSLEDEFEEYKRKAMEKEQRLGRQLQDEINKNRKK